MPKGTAIIVSALTTAAVIGSTLVVSPTSAREVVDVEDMRKYCQGRVAENFHVRPRDIVTLPLERSGDGYAVFGQYPSTGADVTTFECHFGANGKWKRVRKTGESDSQAHDREDRVAEADMPRFCAGEAAAAFDQRPQDILTLPLETDPGGYVVYGQYPPEGPHVKTFECHFSRSRVFKTVYRS